MKLDDDDMGQTFYFAGHDQTKSKVTFKRNALIASLAKPISIYQIMLALLMSYSTTTNLWFEQEMSLQLHYNCFATHSLQFN